MWATVKKQQQTARCYLILSTLTACVFCTTTTQEIDCGGANLEVAWLMKVKVKQYYYYYCGSSPTRQAPLFATNSTRVDRVSRERNVSWLCGVAVCSIWRGVSYERGEKEKDLTQIFAAECVVECTMCAGVVLGTGRQAGTLFWFGPANVCQ